MKVESNVNNDVDFMLLVVVVHLHVGVGDGLDLCTLHTNTSKLSVEQYQLC